MQEIHKKLITKTNHHQDFQNHLHFQQQPSQILPPLHH